MSRTRGSILAEEGDTRGYAAGARHRACQWATTPPALALAFYVLLSAVDVSGQHTEAVCSNSSLSWAFNSLGQSPCVIAAYMASPCSVTGDYNIPAIQPTYYYNPSSKPSICECSTVTYSLYSACAACQNGTVGPWSTFTQNCTTTEPDGQYPYEIPPGTALPAWAYQSITDTNRFNLTLAESVGGTPENITTASSTSISSGPSQTSSSADPSGSNSGGDGNKSSTPIGLIVGGVAGGVALIILGTGLAFFFIRRRRRDNGFQRVRKGYVEVDDDNRLSLRPSLDGKVDYMGEEYMGTGENLPPLGSNGPYYTPVYQPVNPVLSSKFYDPEDPSTFPPNPGPGSNWSTADTESTLVGPSIDVPISPRGGAKWKVGGDGYRADHPEI